MGDGTVLELLADALTDYRTARRDASKVDAVTESSLVLGYKEAPESVLKNRAGKWLLTLLIECGLTPRSRHDVRARKGEDTDTPLRIRHAHLRDPNLRVS
jgi:hypothetical protein